MAINEKHTETTTHPKAEVICSICKSSFRTDETQKQRGCNCGNIECDVTADYIRVLDLFEKGYIYKQNSITIYSPLTLTEIYDKGTEVFGDIHTFVCWLTKENESLENRCPLDVLKQEGGYQKVFNEIVKNENIKRG